jgi:hypothetical protein
LGGQILPEVHRARKGVTRSAACKEKEDAIARLAHLAAQFDLIALYRSDDLLARKLALMHAFYPVARLLEV